MNPYMDERYCAVRVTFRLADTQTAADGIAFATSECAMSQLQQTLNNVDSMSKKLASLEHNYFLLDGKISLVDFPEGLESGWWSGGISDATGAIDEALTFTFTKAHASIGFTIVFDQPANECAENFTVLLYNGAGALIAEKTVIGNKLTYCPVSLRVPAYRKAVIRFTKTRIPRRRVRVAEVIFGIIQTFEPQNFSEFTLLRELAPDAARLPVSEMTITIDNLDHQYNMINADGMYYYLQQGQPLDVEIGIGKSFEGIQYTNCGRYYFKAAAAEDNAMTAKITAQDQLFLLDNIMYRKGTDRIDTVKNVVSDILYAGGTGMASEIPPEIADRQVYTRIPVITCREALRMVAEAACCACFIGYDDILRFTDFPSAAPTDILDQNNLQDVPKITVSERINVAEVCLTELIAGDQESEIYKGAVDIAGMEKVWITYSSPAAGVVAKVDGGLLERAEYYLYAACLTISGSGMVTITAYGITYSTSESVQSCKNIENLEREQAVQIKNSLVIPAEAKNVASWALKNAQRMAYRYAVTGRGNPWRDIADTVQIFDAYGENRNAVITKQQIHYNGGMEEAIEAVGQKE